MCVCCDRDSSSSHEGEGAAEMDGVGAGHEASAPVPQEPGNGLCCRGNKGREAGGTGGARGGRAGMDAAAGAGTRAGGRPGYCVVAVGNECRAGAAWKESWPTSCSSGPMFGSETDRGFTSSGGTTGGGSDDRAAERLGVSLFNSFSTNVW
mmetsp:Transcript_9133/g.24612  ORF Transcript_9133/g.24612 Transcript_9133/m.24612 type:complete len:151 (+) Transcript_9133:2498-2950(+)